MKKLLLALGVTALLLVAPPAGFSQTKSQGDETSPPPTDYKPPPDDYQEDSDRACNQGQGCGTKPPSLQEQKDARANARAKAKARLEAATKVAQDAILEVAAECGAAQLDALAKAQTAFAELSAAIEFAAQYSKEAEPAEAAMAAAHRAMTYYEASKLPGSIREGGRAEDAYAAANKLRDKTIEQVKQRLLKLYGFGPVTDAQNCPSDQANPTPEQPKDKTAKTETPGDQPPPKSDSGGGGKTSKSKPRHPMRTGSDTQPRTDTPQPGTDNPTLPKLEETPTPPDRVRPTDQVMASREGGNQNGLENVAATVALSSDGVAWCTYGVGQGVQVSLTPSDENGRAVTSLNISSANNTSVNLGRTIAVADTPAVNPAPAAGQVVTSADRTPGPADNQPAASDRPASPAEAPPTADATPPKSNTPTPNAAVPVTDAPPPVTDIPPPADTPSTPDTIVVTIFYKVNEEALKQRGASSELPTQTEKVIFASPDLPGSGNKATADKDFDQNPLQSKSDAHGTSTIRMRAEDATALGMANLKPGYYRVDRDLLTSTGLIAETTGNTGKPDFASVTPAGGHIVATTFKIGAQTMIRLEIEQPYGMKIEDLAPYTRILGAKVVIDYCRTTKPGVPLGAHPESLSTHNQEVAQATLRLDRRVHTGRTVR
jgi:hypothetical protein